MRWQQIMYSRLISLVYSLWANKPTNGLPCFHISCSKKAITHNSVACQASEVSHKYEVR